MSPTAYCTEHERLEAFRVLAEVKVNRDSRDSLLRQGALHVSVEFDCGEIDGLIVPYEVAVSA